MTCSGQLVRTGLEEADPALVKTGCWPFVPVGSDSLIDAADHLPRPAGSLGGDANQRPVIAGEVFLAINVAIPLVTVRAVLIAFVLDDQLVLQVDQVDPAHRALVIADDHIAFRHRQPGQNEAEPKPGLAR